MGADVIKVESPDGDIMRHMGAGRSRAMGPIHLSVNRNKKSLMLDLRIPEARAALLRVVATADVFVHAMRPAAIERLGLGYAQIKEINLASSTVAPMALAKAVPMPTILPTTT